MPISKLVNSLKGVSARYLRQEFRTHLSRYPWSGHLWSPRRQDGSRGGLRTIIDPFYRDGMTLVELPKSAAAPLPPPRRRLLRWLVGTTVLLVLLSGVAYGLAVYYYASVPIPRDKTGAQAVRAGNLHPGVANAIVAAVDPDFYGRSSETIWPSSEITKRYTVVAMGVPWDDLESWQVRVGAHKLEGWYSKEQLLDFYLNTAHYGEGATGILEGARLYFDKHPRDLTVAEGALLAAHLDAVSGDLPTAWARVLDTMVEHGWLTDADRARLVYPKTIQR